MFHYIQKDQLAHRANDDSESFFKDCLCVFGVLQKNLELIFASVNFESIRKMFDFVYYDVDV